MALALPATAQSVISTHSGVIHYFEGAVSLGDQPLEPHLGSFPSLPQGGELSTMEGRAEVLLTPGVFLRMGEQSAIRLLANDLADTRVELQAGSAIVDSAEPNPGTSVTLVFKNWSVHFLQKGVYRIDSNPPCFSVSQGEAEVLAADSGEPVFVEQGMSLPLADALAPQRSAGQLSDALSDWSKGRGQSITADNAIASEIDEDPATLTAGLDNFTYFPFLGVSSLGTVAPTVYGSPSVYSSYTPYQPGFNSIYLPGYTYAPLILGLLGNGNRVYAPYTPRPTVLPRLGVVSPRPGVTATAPRTPPPAIVVPRPAPTPARPAPVVVRPAAPAPARVGVGGGLRR
jgi:hypothetical protein